VDTIAGIAASQDHADRIELCSALALGGLTPSPGLFAATRDSAVPVHAMIRPRSGGFEYDKSELDACVADIRAARAAGCTGIVIGAAKHGRLDVDALQRFVDEAQGMSCTLHRVIDVLDDPLGAMDDAIALGLDHILTSGGAASAEHGIAGLTAMQNRAAGRISVMAGSGITVSNLRSIAKTTGIRAFHSSCSIRTNSAPRDVKLGFAQPNECVTSAAQIANLRAAVDAI
jgi:copper homeostasis protein